MRVRRPIWRPAVATVAKEYHVINLPTADPNSNLCRIKSSLVRIFFKMATTMTSSKHLTPQKNQKNSKNSNAPINSKFCTNKDQGMYVSKISSNQISSPPL